MSEIVQISSQEQFTKLISSTTVVIADFYADWCGPCKIIAPRFEQLAKQYSRPQAVQFAKVNVDQHKDIAGTFGITAMPTFLIFKDGSVTDDVQGANANLLQQKVNAAMGTVNQSGEASSGTWLGGSVPRNYQDITDQVEVKGIDLLNCDSEIGPGKALFETSKPSALREEGNTNNGKGKASTAQADWVESDTDEQLMLFIPFQSSIKIHSLQITSLPPTTSSSSASDEVPVRPRTIKLFINKPHNIGFEDADDQTPTQNAVIEAGDWDSKTGTATVNLRFVKFQGVTSLVVYFVDGEEGGEKIRVDRIRIFGERGEKREMGKLEKIGDETGE